MEDAYSHTRSSSQDSPLTAITTPEVILEDDDIWASDDANDNSHAENIPRPGNDILSDLPTVKRQHMTDGYREGLSIGKAKVMQDGFDAGYPIGVAIAMRAGKILGFLEGVLAAKDITDEDKVPVRRAMTKAKEELAITSLLRDMTDQDIMSFTHIPATVHSVLLKWEVEVYGQSSTSKSDNVSQG